MMTIRGPGVEEPGEEEAEVEEVEVDEVEVDEAEVEGDAREEGEAEGAFDQGVDVLKVLRPRGFDILRIAGRSGERMCMVELILGFVHN